MRKPCLDSGWERKTKLKNKTAIKSSEDTWDTLNTDYILEGIIKLYLIFLGGVTDYGYEGNSPYS